MKVPVGVVAGVASLHLVPRHEPRRGLGRELDLAGAALAVAGLVTLCYALTGAPAHGWGSARTLLLLALAVVLLAAFAVVERSVPRPLVPAQLWQTRSLVAGVLVMLGATGILVGMFFLNSLQPQDVQHASALRVGLEFLPLALVIGASAHLGSRLLPRAGARVLIVAGLLVMGAGALLLTGVSARSGYLTGFLPGLLVVGIGTGLVLPATAIAAMSDIAEDRAGVASGLMTTAHEIGAALGVAVFSAVAVATSGGIAAGGYRDGFAVAAAVAGGLAVVAAVLVPAVRPAAGSAWRCTEMATARPLTGYQREVAERNVEAILDAAEDLLQTRGYANISAVAVQARVSRVTVYAHFPTWEALLEAAVERAVRRTMAALRSVHPKTARPSRRWTGCSLRPGSTWRDTGRWPRRWPSC